MEFTHTFLVRQRDIDAQNHVNNVAYVQWIQDVAVAHWQAAASAEHLANYTWVVIRHEVDYLKPAFLNEEITAITWVGEATAVTFERFTEIRRGAVTLTKAKSIWCLLDAKTFRPTRLKAEIKELF